MIERFPPTPYKYCIHKCCIGEECAYWETIGMRSYSTDNAKNVHHELIFSCGLIS